MRRHHLVFAVDRNGNTIEEWLQHDRLFAPPRGTGLGEVGRGPHKLLINPYDTEKHVWIVDDDQHVINIFTNDGTLVTHDGRARRARARAEQLQSADRHRLAARRHVLRRRRLRRHARGEVRSERQVPDGLGPSAGRSRQARALRVLVGAQHRHQPRPARLRGRSRAPPHAGLRRERQVPGDVADRPRLGGARPTSSPRTTSSGWPTGPPTGSSSTT